jgi:ribosome-associated toxin RatA of RatAB toxin-antitoxin module
MLTKPPPGDDHATAGRRRLSWHVIFEPNLNGRFLACVALLSGLASAPCRAETPWVSAGVHDGIALERPADGDLPEIGARLRIDRPVACVLAVVTDYDRFTEFVPYTAESRVIGVEGGRLRVYQRLALPAPIADRAYVLESTVTHAARVDFGLAADQDAARASGAITPRVFRGHWELTTAEGGRATAARYAIALDPGGRLPRWLVRLSLERFVPAIVSAVRSRAESQPCAVN